MKPFDARLLRQARATWLFIGALVVLGLAAAALVMAQAQILASVIVAAAGRADGGLLERALAAFAMVVAGRALVAWTSEVASHRAGAAVTSQLRRRVLARAASLGPGWLAGQRRASLATLATSGVDALEGYFASYLPQLALAVIVPAAVTARIFCADLVAGSTIVLTLPLIPAFAALVGRAAHGHAERRWRALAILSHHFLDVVAGLATLKVFGRSAAQARSIRDVTDEYRRATMGTLRLAFLSSMVLEFAATTSVAMIAAGVGLELVYGDISLRAGLLVLLLAPEVYLPLRQAAAHFHTSADGLAAAGEVFAVLEAAPDPGTGTGQARGLAGPPCAVRVQEVRVTRPGRPGAAPDGVSLTITAGQIAAVAGPSGCGKSTLIAVVLRFAAPSAGRVLAVDRDCAATDLACLDPDGWRSFLAWAPQNPVLFPGTVESNIKLGWPDAPPWAVAAAAHAAALEEVPLAGPVGERGNGLSAGQRHRVALARALLPGRPVLLLDEPTAGLDHASEAHVVASLRREAAAGRAVLVATHRPAVLAAADSITWLTPPPRAVGPAPARETARA